MAAYIRREGSAGKWGREEETLRRLTVFNHVSLDGYFVDANGEMSWAHGAPDDEEWNAFVAGNASGGGELVFGRVTYELMAGYWPTPLAASNSPEVAERMNSLPKIVFSRTLASAAWSNTQLLREDAAIAMRALKKKKGPDMVILGSGRIVACLAGAGLVDELQVVVNPVVLGGGRTMFEGVATRLALRLTSTRAFANGKVVVCYEPALGGSPAR
jgi:dihydrofolate reductase